MRYLITSALCALISATALGKDGVRASLEPATAYRSIEGTRQEGVVAASAGFVKRDHDYGMRLAFGPAIVTDHWSAGVQYAPGFMVRSEGAAAYHEADLVLRMGIIGFTTGYAWEHGSSINCPQGSGLGKRSFARVSIGWNMP